MRCFDVIAALASVLVASPSLSISRLGAVSESDSSETSEASLTPVDPSMLRYDQFRAYDIITWHLDQTLAGEKIPPLRMIIHGEGGTGKSKVIQTVTKYFALRGVKHILLKAAYTGVAASLIDGKTTHMTIGMMSQGDHDSGGKLEELSVGAKAKLQALWKPIQYLIIDEISMIGKAKVEGYLGGVGNGLGLQPKHFAALDALDLDDEPDVPLDAGPALWVGAFSSDEDDEMDEVDGGL